MPRDQAEIAALIASNEDARAPSDRGVSNDPSPDLQELQFRIDVIEHALNVLQYRFDNMVQRERAKETTTY